MRLKGIASGVGTILLFFPISLLLPFITGLFYSEDIIQLLLTFILPALFAFLLGILLTSYGGRADKIGQDMRPVEALVVVAIVWWSSQ